MPVIDIRDYGAIGDRASDATTTADNVSAIRAALAAVPVAGGVLYIPAGTYNFGTASTAILPMQRSNVEVCGDGQGVTILQYTSPMSTDGTVGPGSFFLPAQQTVPSPLFTDLTFRDFTIQDLNTGSSTSSGHGPSAIDAAFVEDFLCERVEFVDIKGNGALTVLGYAPNTTSPVTQRITIQDCRFRGTTAGGGIQYDAVNPAAAAHLVVRRNRFEGGIFGNAMEFGAAISHLTVEGNYVDMNSQGLACVASFTIVADGVIRGNRFYNWSNAESAISVNPDLTTLPVNNLTIEDNDFSSSAGSAAIVVSDGVLSTHSYLRNRFVCPSPSRWPKFHPDRP